jgi:hypothetical protein
MPVIQAQIGPLCCDQERSAILFRDAATATSPDGSCQVRRSCMPNQGHIGDRSSAQPMATIPDQGRKLDKDSLRALAQDLSRRRERPLRPQEVDELFDDAWHRLEAVLAR